MSDLSTAHNFFDPDIMNFPFDMYRQMRKREPISPVVDPSTGLTVYMVTPYSLVQKIFRTPELYSNRHSVILFAGGSHNPEAEAILARGWPEMDTFDSDPPDHSRYRTLANKAFNPGAISKLTEFIREIIDNLIDGFIEDGEVDFHERFAIPLPIYAIIGILGVERTMKDKFHRWSDAYGILMTHQATAMEEVEAALQIVEFQHYVRELIDSRRTIPCDDIISALIDARDGDNARFTDNELLSMIRQFMLAGSETTRNSLTAGMGMLLHHPEQLEQLRRDPTMIGAAIDEILRVQSPVGGIWRIVREDHSLEGTMLRKGDIVMIRMDSANHDESMFNDPDAFDINRSNLRQHVAFGNGIHFCLGAMLARKELLEAFPKLIQRLHDIKIVESRTDLRYQPSILLRAPRALYLSFRPGERLRTN